MGNYDSLDKLYDLQLSEQEIENLYQENVTLSKNITDKYELDSFEQSMVYIAGIVAGAVDAFFVTDARILKESKGITIRKNGQSIHLKDSGIANKFIDKRIKNIYSPEKIKIMEAKFKVPYDASTNCGLKQTVLGLNPTTHRITSLGHDPIAGFYYGIKDILNGTFTAIDNAGEVIVQVNPKWTSSDTIFEAFARQIGHLLSDISTSTSLPIPFMSQLMKLQGHSSVNGLSYPMLIKSMYLKGYNVSHFVTMGIPAMLIEMIIRITYFVYNLSKGESFKNSLPLNSPKLDRMLFRSYLIASACNGVKVYVTGGNIYAFNPTLYAQMFKYGIGEFKRWVTNEMEVKRHNYIMDRYDAKAKEIDDEIDEILKFYNISDI